MTRISRTIFLLCGILALMLLAGLAEPQPAAAQSLSFQGSGCDRVVMGGVCTIAEGETVDHNLVVIGGTLIVEEGGTLNGDVTLTGGTVRVAGSVHGDIVATGGLVTLEQEALVTGDVSLADARLNRESGAQVEGVIRTNAAGPFRFTSTDGLRSPLLRVSLDPLWQMLTFLFRSFLWAALAILIVLFLPRQVQTVAQGAMRQPILVGGVGLLTVVLVSMLLIVLAITLIGIPIAAVGAVALVSAWVFGLVALGIEVGTRLARALKQDWAPPVSAGIGTFLLVAITGAVSHFMWIGDWLLPALVGVLGLGAVVLTRFGSQPYPPPAPFSPASPADSASPPPPELPQIPTSH